MALEMGSSERTRSRMDKYVCVNTSGLQGGGIFRDKMIEIVIRSVKTKLRNLHSGISDLTIDKAVSSLSTLHLISNHNQGLIYFQLNIFSDLFNCPSVYGYG